MVKEAFTFIELIFVIVILGILMAVAIPRLAVTRNDAETVKIVTQLKNAMKEMITYYTTRGVEINFSKIPEGQGSQIALNELINHGWLEIKDDHHAEFFSNKENKTVCIDYYTNGAQIEVKTTNDDSTLCQDIKRYVKDRNYSVLNGVVNF